MKRKKIGGAVIKCSDLQKVLDNKANYPGIIFKISNPKSQSGVALEVYSAVIGLSGLALGKKIRCTVNSCSIKKGSTSTNLGKYEFEHCSQFSLFDEGEPFIAYFSRSQIEMLFNLGAFKKVFISSYMVVSSNPMVNAAELIPNFSLEMQPYGELKTKKSRKITAKNKNLSFGLPGTVRAAGCPRAWRQEG